MKKSLINCIAECRALGKSEDEAILVYLRQEDCLDDDMFNNIYQIFINNYHNLKSHYRITMSWMTLDNGHYYAKYDFETARHLDSLTRRMQMNMPFVEEDIAFMREFDVTTIDAPFWNDLYEAIKAVQNVNYTPKFYGGYTQPITVTEEISQEGE